MDPDLLGQGRVNPELAQTLLGASLGLLGMDLIAGEGADERRSKV
jgi:hypothetical protein